jgi:hypothetical protein
MSDIDTIVVRLLHCSENCGDEYLRELTGKAADTITRLTAEVERRDAALRECEAELNAYYRMGYPGDHPYSQQELAQTMASNPATVALSGDKQ